MQISTTYRRLVANAGSNTAGYLAQLVVTFAMTPMILRSLGDQRYGAWSFVESFVAYLTLFDFGVAAALVRFVPRCLARHEDEQLDRIYSASLLFFSSGALLAMALGGVFAWCFLDLIIHLPEYRTEVHTLFVLLVLNFSLSFPLSVYPAILDGLGRFVFKSSVRTVMLIFVRTPLMLIALRMDQRLIALGCVITTCTLVEHVIMWLGVRSAVPRLAFRPRSVDRESLRLVGGYGRDAFIAMMAGRLAFHTDAFVIGPFLGPAAITVFSFPAKMVESAKAALRSATTTLTAAFSAIEATGDHARLRETFLASSRAAWTLAIPIQIGLLILGKSFLSLWVGPHFAMVCAPVLWILAPMLCFTIAQSVASRVLYGTGRLTLFARAAILEGIVNLLLSLALVVPFGIPGVALGTALPHALFCCFVIGYVNRMLDVSLAIYARCCIGSLICAAPSAAAWGVLAQSGIDSWVRFLGVGVAGVAVYCALFFLFQWITAPTDKSPAIPLPWRRAG